MFESNNKISKHYKSIYNNPQFIIIFSKIKETFPKIRNSFTIILFFFKRSIYKIYNFKNEINYLVPQ